MSMATSPFKNRAWTKDNYVISTDPSLIDLATVNTFFASAAAHWTHAVPEPELALALQNSVCFGLYLTTSAPSSTSDSHSPSTTTSTTTLKQVGMARLITDHATFIWLTDVLIPPPHQGRGLGKWLIACIREIVEPMPHLRRIMLITADWTRSVPFYERELGMSVMEMQGAGVGVAVMEREGKGWPVH